MPMDNLLPYRAMAHNNAWAKPPPILGLRLPVAGGVHCPAGWFLPKASAPPLNHILVIDHFYVDAMEGGTLGPAAWADPEPYGTVAHSVKRRPS